jgi:hypothetical protein
VRVDLATGGERVLLAGPRVRWARLTARDERVLAAVNEHPAPGGVALAYRLPTPDGREVGRVAGPPAPPPPVFVWGSLPADARED